MSQLSAPTGVEYSEAREHEVRKVMIDGNLTANTETNEGGSGSSEGGATDGGTDARRSIAERAATQHTEFAL